MTDPTNRDSGATILVISTGRDGVPYRAWMRLHGQPRRQRRRLGGVCVRCGARADEGVPITLDHIVPQAGLGTPHHVLAHHR